MNKVIKNIIDQAIYFRLRFMKKEKKNKDVSFISSPDGDYKITIERIK